MAARFFSFLLLLFLLCAGQRLWAQADPAAMQLSEVEVKASRLAFSAGNRSSAADSLLLALHRQSSLAELLRQVSPVFVKSYGPGNLATLSVRGTTANQTALVWNGIQINSPTTGLSDLNLIAPGNMQQVQLVHGPQSALYGSGAVGGTLFLSSRPPEPEEHALELAQAAGSFRSRQTRAGASYGTKKWQARSYYQYSSALNNFPFTNFYLPDRPTQRTAHAAFAQHTVSQDFFFKPSVRTRASVHGWYSSAQRQIPPVMSVPRSVAEQHDRALRLCGSISHASAMGSTTARLGFLNDYLLYLNPQILSLQTLPARTATWLAEAEHTLQYRRLKVNAGASTRQTQGRIAEYGRPAFLSQHAFFLSLRQQLGRGTTISANGRKELVTGFDPDPTFSLGLEQHLTRSGQLIFKAQAANSFRVPTLNERFWQPGGNPQLLPEKGLSAEAGLAWLASSGNPVLQQAEVTVYSSQVRQMIVWRPVSSMIYSPYNLDRVWARGAELSLKARWQVLPRHKAALSVQSAYAYTRSTLEATSVRVLEGRQLIYVPEHAASLFAAIETRWLNAGWQQNWNGQVYTSPDNRQFLPGYLLTDVMVWSPECRFSRLRVHITGIARNIFDTTYQTVRNVPMPGRSFEVRVQLLLPFHNQPTSND